MDAWTRYSKTSRSLLGIAPSKSVIYLCTRGMYVLYVRNVHTYLSLPSRGARLGGRYILLTYPVFVHRNKGIHPVPPSGGLVGLPCRWISTYHLTWHDGMEEERVSYCLVAGYLAYRGYTSRYLGRHVGHV